MNMAAEKILATSTLVKGLRILLISYDCMAVSFAVCQVTNKDYYYYYYYYYYYVFEVFKTKNGHVTCPGLVVSPRI